VRTTARPVIVRAFFDSSQANGIDVKEASAESAASGKTALALEALAAADQVTKTSSKTLTVEVEIDHLDDSET